MGFKKGSFAKVWEVKSVSELRTDLRITISKKNNTTGDYDVDFSGYVNVLGKQAAPKAAELENGASIQLGDVDVSRTYNAENKETYVNFKVFSFELSGSNFKGSNKNNNAKDDGYKAIDDGEIEATDLPF